MDDPFESIHLVHLDDPIDPRLLFFAEKGCAIDRLQQTFRLLSARSKPVDFRELEFIIVHGDLQLIAKSTSEREGWLEIRSHGLHRIGPNAFRWSQPADIWEDLAVLIEGMVNSPTRPSHQYLSNYSIDDATVIVSIGEYRADHFGPV